MPFTDSNGKEYKSLNCTICPIGEHLYEDKWQLSGTGFYINAQGIALTAAHNFQSRKESKVKRQENQGFNRINTPAFFRILPDQGSSVKIEITQMQKIILSKDADIAIVMSGIDANHEKPPLMLNLTSKILEIGEKIYCYSYPNLEGNTNNITGKLALRSVDFEGQITNFFRNGRDSFLMPGPCYEAEMNVTGGTSGGPVFNESGHVIGVVSTSIEGEPSITYITPIYPILDVKFEISTDLGNKFFTLRELSKRNLVSLIE